MYESHFGFTGSPFQLNPDPAFYFDSKGHSNALAYLKFGAHQGEGFIVVTGEIGAGKTTLVRTLLDGLNPEQVVAAQVVSTQLQSTELLQAILMAFGVPSGSTSKAHLIASLEGFLTALAAKGRRALLIIDEAQNLRHEAVEELRMLSNFQLGNYGLLQSFLVGQPELRGLLQSKSMEQLRQRVIASCHLGPLTQAETCAYVQHRLRRVGWKGASPQFAGGVLDRIHVWTGGVPRKINRLCNRLLLGAFLANASTISVAMVDETALELKNEIGEANSGPAESPRAAPSENVPSEANAITKSTVAPLTPGATAGTDLAASGLAGALSDGPPAQVPAASPVVSQPVIPAKLVKTTSAPEPVHSNLTVVAARRPEEMQQLEHSQPPALLPAVAESTVVRHIHLPASSIQEPLFCLVNSSADYLKAGILARVFRDFPSLPRVVVVHAGGESELGIDDLHDLQMPLPAAAVHLGIARDGYARTTSKILTAFDELLDEFMPRAVLTFGSSEADLACSLVARKRGITLLRVGAGRRDADQPSSSESNASLIEKTADLLFTDSSECFYALYREGIHLDRVFSTGNLTREMLDVALTTLRAETFTRPGVKGDYGLISVDPRSVARQPGALRKTVDLFCTLGRELPLAWMMSPIGFQLLASDHAKRLEAAGIRLHQSTCVRPVFDYVCGAKCLIANDEDPWLEESKLLGIPTIRLTPDLSLARFKLLLRDTALLVRPPDYWDTGTATRIAGQLTHWQAKTGVRRHAQKIKLVPIDPA